MSMDKNGVVNQLVPHNRWPRKPVERAGKDCPMCGAAMVKPINKPKSVRKGITIMNNIAKSLARACTGGNLVLDETAEQRWEAIEQAFHNWQWDGATLAEIQAQVKTVMRMEAFVESLQTWQEKKLEWQATVPAEYQGLVFGAENGEEINGIEILAIDQQGQALVQKSRGWEYEWLDVDEAVEMPKADAMALVDKYREARPLSGKPGRGTE